MKSIAQRLAAVSVQVADIDNQIVQQQKRVENLRARGADPTEAQAVLMTMMQTRADLEAHKAELLRHQSAGE